VDAIRPGERILLIDDLLATGGTSAAALDLVRKFGGKIVEAQFLIELEFLKGRARIEPVPVRSFLQY
jgi:adenine phosphoribosyltransferase